MRSKKNKYFEKIDYIRILACASVLLYHLGLLKGGYLAVCTFFVLSGYFTVKEFLKKDDFSLKKHYINRFKKIYIPLIIVAFSTIAVIQLFGIDWLNLKPETTSVLCGYNNFWQLNANADYFARSAASPFTHLWYISILIQFDLIFPLIGIFIRKVKTQKAKKFTSILSLILTIFGIGYFYISTKNMNMMTTYYNTFTRLFSLLAGVSLGIITSYYKFVVNKKKINKIFNLNFILLLLMFIFIDAKSKLYPIGMILTTIISCLLIYYGSLKAKLKLSNKDMLFKIISKATYGIYLIQYPVIYLFEYIKLSKYVEISLIIIIVIFISFILNYVISFKNKTIIKKLLQFEVLILIAFGIFVFFRSTDHTRELKDLEKQLNENKELIKDKQQEYLNNLKEEEQSWESTLKDLENGLKDLDSVVSNLKVVGVGDSVMLGAVPNLYKQFTNGYFDAEISRTCWVLDDILLDLKNKKMLGDVLVFNFGSNGDCNVANKKEIMKIVGDRKVFWLTTTYDKVSYVNDNLKEFAKSYDNFYVIDWDKISDGHTEYFAADKIHLTGTGRKAYTKVVYDAIYDVYYKELKETNEEIIKEHENKQKDKISFYGNNILLNSFNNMHEAFSTSKFVINNTYNELINTLNKNNLTHKLVFVFDNSVKFTLNEYKEIISKCKDNKIYIVVTDKYQADMLNEIENINIIDFYNELTNNPNYLMRDGIHLTEEGNIALTNKLKEILNN